MSKHTWLYFCVTLMALALPAQAQVIYHHTPDWQSSDKKVATGAAFADIDQDGWLDLVVANGNDMVRQYLQVYYNQGDGTFPATADWSAADKTFNGHLDVADVNGDGWPDVAVSHLLDSVGGSSAAKLYLNNNGVLSSLPDWDSREDARTFGIAFGDVNNDGRPDLAVGTGWCYSPSVSYPNYVYLNVNGTLNTTADWESADQNTDQGVLWVDADDDGWLDLVATGGKKATRIYRNLGGTLDTNPVWVSTDNNNQDAIMIAAGDVTGDGLAELFVTDNIQLGGGSGYFRQYDGLPAGYFTTTPTWSYYDGYGSAVTLADVDADGDLDLATGAWWDKSRLFYNTGTGFGAAPSWSSNPSSVVEKIVFGDIDPTADTVKSVLNTFPPAGGRRLFHLSRRHIQEVTLVRLDGAVLGPHQYVVNRENGWITVPTAPAVSLKVRFSYSVSLDMGVTNWDNSVGNYLYYNQRPPKWLKIQPAALSAATGGSADLTLDAGQEFSARNYFMLGSISGTSPGTPFPGTGVTLPLNWDFITNLVYAQANTPSFTDFHGVLDGSGMASALFDTLGPLPPSAVGAHLYFAYLLYNPIDFASNAVDLEITL